MYKVYQTYVLGISNVSKYSINYDSTYPTSQCVFDFQ